MEERLGELLPDATLQMWNVLVSEVDSLYAMDKTWNKGFRDWEIEYKYRRGGKTLCTFYAKKNAASILITYGKTERKRFEEIKNTVSQSIQDIYETTETLYDGKWLWIPIDKDVAVKDIIAMLKIKRKPNKK